MGTVYGFCGNNCRYPVYTQEQILSILQQAIESGSLQGINPDDSPVVALIREKRVNADVSMWVGTEAEYNELAPGAALVMGRLGVDGTMYFCTDDSTLQAWHDTTVQNAAEAAAKAIAHKQDAITGAAGQFVGFNEIGNPVAKTVNASDVGAATTATYTATVGTGWTANGDHFYVDVVVNGITANDNPVVDINPGSDNAANVIYGENICKVFRITTSANSVRIWATKAIASNFPIQIKVVR